MSRFKRLMPVLLTLLLLGLTIPGLVQAGYWQQVWSRFSATAGETLTTGEVVCLPSNGTIWKAKVDESTLFPAVGVIGKGGAAGETVEVVTSGILAGMTAQTNGTRLYVDNTAGLFNSTAAGGNQTLGVALPGGTRYLIQVGMPIGQ